MRTWLGALLVSSSMIMACTGKVAAIVDPVPVPMPDPTPTTPAEEPGAKATCGGPSVEVLDPATSEGYRVSSYKAAAIAAGPEVHILGVYETRSDHSAGSHPRGSATAHVSRQGRHVLVLSSYEPTDFVVTADPGATIERVILNGYQHHTVKAPAGTEIVDRSGENVYLSACAYKWPSDDQGCDTQALVDGVKKLTSAEITTFTGVYRATKFVVGSDGTAACPSTPAIDLSAECTGGYDFTRYTSEAPTAPALVVLGKYESDSSHSYGNHPTGSTTVHVDASPSPIVLVLSSYEPTQWVLDAAPGATIQRILLSGYHDQSITNAGAIPVETQSLTGYAYAWPSTSGGSDTPAFVSGVEARTGLKLAAFGGCYQAKAFSVGLK